MSLQSVSRPRRFTLSHALMAACILVLGIALWIAQVQLSDARQQLAAYRPIPVEDVARQFEQRASVGPLSVRVDDVRYSPDEKAYLVDFAWTEPETQRIWTSSVNLVGDGYGHFRGTIRSDQFTSIIGNPDGFRIEVQAPSELTN